MFNLKVLNKKESNEVIKSIKKQFDIKELELDYIFFKNSENKIFLINRDLKKFDFSSLRINSLGVYFCKIEKDSIRVSIEGSQLIGENAKNIVELNDKEIEKWIRGNEIEKTTDKKGFVIVKYKDDFYGCGKVKEGKILNYVPKPRRLRI